MSVDYCSAMQPLAFVLEAPQLPSSPLEMASLQHLVLWKHVARTSPNLSCRGKYPCYQRPDMVKSWQYPQPKKSWENDCSIESDYLRITRPNFLLEVHLQGFHRAIDFRSSRSIRHLRSLQLLSFPYTTALMMQFSLWIQRHHSFMSESAFVLALP